MRRSEGEEILLQRYVRVHGKHLNLTNPQKFTEKLFCRMISLNRRQNPIFTQLSDKFTARAYVGGKVGEQHLVKLLWHGEDPREIPFDTLPAEYVIKPNHGSGQVIVVKGKADRTDIISRLSVWLESNYYWACRESQYYHIKPRVMIEEYLRSQDGSGPLDYRFWCFKGVPEVIQVDNHAHDINPFFDTEWNQLDLYYREGASRPPIAKPSNFEQMMLIASQLSAGFDFVRVDLYDINGKIYFGEFTLTPTGGELKLRPESWDLKLGEKWEMPTKGRDHNARATSQA
ncbi:MAG: ATP-grasp fold amidoligase family protein [Nitrospiraceae bacterium]